MLAEPTVEKKTPATYIPNRSEGRASSRSVLDGGEGIFTPDTSEPENPIGFDACY
jgi:hypothetical protein